HSTRLGELLKSGSDVDSVAIDCSIPLLYYIAKVDSDAKLHAPVLGQLGISLREFALIFHRGVNRFDSAGKLAQNAVSGRIDKEDAVGFGAPAKDVSGLVESAKGGGFVVGHQPRIAGDIGCENSDKFTSIHRPPLPDVYRETILNATQL